MAVSSSDSRSEGIKDARITRVTSHRRLKDDDYLGVVLVLFLVLPFYPDSMHGIMSSCSERRERVAHFLVQTEARQTLNLLVWIY